MLNKFLRHLLLLFLVGLAACSGGSPQNPGVCDFYACAQGICPTGFFCVDGCCKCESSYNCQGGLCPDSYHCENGCCVSGGGNDGGLPLEDGGGLPPEDGGGLPPEDGGGLPPEDGGGLPPEDGGPPQAEFWHRIQAQGTGSNRIGTVSIQNSLGSALVGGMHSALSYHVTDWTTFGFSIYHTLAPTADNLHVLYLYCGVYSPGSLDSIYHESYAHEMKSETAYGTCSANYENFSTPFVFADLPPMPTSAQLLTGFTISGAEINVDDLGGSLTLDGASMNVYPFEPVDCTQDCTNDPADGWWEMHVMLQNTITGERCFGIFYLMLKHPNEVSLQYGFCLETFRYVSASYTATWSTPQIKSGPGSWVPMGPRHPELGYILRPRPEVPFLR